jgi:RNA-directed DNA polymerase
MTNGPGKSDRPEVPEKSPNKAGPSAAEGTEGRGLAKGNLPQQNASRTPSREDALSALERVRQAATKDKKLRFTALLHHIYNLETLRMAYFSLKKEAAAGDQRLISLMRRWLKAGVLEDGHPSEEGTPQGGSVSVLLSNVYLHYGLDLWFERVVKPRLRGEACVVRYIDDFVLCFQYRADALRAQEALVKRLRKFSLTLEPTKTKLVEFGRFASRHASKRGRKRPETIYFLGFTLYCTRNQKGNFRIGMRTEKTRLRRALTRLQDQMRRMRHLTLQDQVNHLNQMLRGHYAYYGVAGNIQALLRVHRAVERYWRKMLSSRSWKATIRWEPFQRIKAQFPLLRPKLYLPYRELQAIAIL